MIKMTTSIMTKKVIISIEDIFTNIKSIDR